MTESSRYLPNKGVFAYRKFFTLLVLLLDLALVVFMDLTAFSLRYGTDIAHPPARNFLAYLEIAKYIIALRILCFYIFGFYRNIASKTLFNIIVSTIKAVTASSIIAIVVAFYFRAFAYPRTVIFLSWVITAFVIIIWRILLQNAISYFSKGPVGNTIIIGTDKQAYRLGMHFGKDAATNVKLAGFIKLSPGENNEKLEDSGEILGSLEDLEGIVDKYSVNEIIVATQNISRQQILRVFGVLAGRNVILKLLPDIYEAAIGNIVISSEDFSSGPSGVLITPLEVSDSWYRGLKRVLDLAFSVLMLVFFLPVMLVVAGLIKITSYGPVIFKQERIGLNGRKFTMYKFRTMHKDAEDDSGPVWAANNDPRITPLGRFLRFSRLDELPQLINVIKNDMSLVGPRPERPYFVDKLIKEIPFYSERLTVKPGITGWAQVTSPYADTLEENKEKLLKDIFYIKNMSLSLDVLIFLKTIWTIIQEKGAH